MDGGPVYRWEQGINATWDAVQEDEHGNLISVAISDRERLHRNRQQKRLSKSIRRGIIRYLVVALDCSESALETDYRPSRIEATSAALQKFVDDYYDQNPISQLAVILTRDRKAEKCSDLSGNARSHIDHLRKVHYAHDLASLESCILLAMKLLRHIPNYGHRELLVVFNSLSSCDAGDIFQTVQKARQAKLRISVITTTAEIFICRQLAELTGGSFNVAIDAAHLSELLQKHTVPPADLMAAPDAAAPRFTEFIRMGFPRLSFSDHRLLGYEGKHLGRFAVGYHCPRCYTRASDIPTKCAVCQLQLNSSSHIARSFHHLFPVPAFVEFQVKVMTRRQLLARAPKVEAAGAVAATGVVVKAEPGTATAAAAPPVLDAHGLPPDLPDVVLVAERVAVDVETYYTDDEDEGDDAAQPPAADDADDTRATTKRRRLNDAAVSCQLVALLPPSSAALRAATLSPPAAGAAISLHADHCYGCAASLRPATEVAAPTDAAAAASTDKILFQCPRCRHLFCIDCDIFVHDALHNCPGCPF